MTTRTIDKIETPLLQPGFLGPGHQAAALVDGRQFQRTDPFMILMDDQLDLPGGPPVGGAHPHAGFETGTLVLQGNQHEWKTGSFELMTAGKGIVHTEEITTQTNVRILQLWLVLPPEHRWAEPYHQQLLLEDVPTSKTEAREIRVYSGSSNGLTSPLKNLTPFTLVDFKLSATTTVTQQLPAGYNGFMFVVEGTLSVGDVRISEGQTGWLNAAGPEESQIDFMASSQGARFVLYAAKPHNAPVVSYGPFIGDTEDDIRRLYSEYRQGKMPHLNDLPENRKVRYVADPIS